MSFRHKLSHLFGLNTGEIRTLEDECGRFVTIFVCNCGKVSGEWPKRTGFGHVANLHPNSRRRMRSEIQSLRELLWECWPCVYDSVYGKNPERRPLLEKMDEFKVKEDSE